MTYRTHADLFRELMRDPAFRREYRRGWLYYRLLVAWLRLRGWLVSIAGAAVDR